MVELGFFSDERVELLDGMLVAMSPQGARHATVVRRLNMLLTPALVGRAEVQVQAPIAASDLSEPEPDIAVVPAGDYLKDHPHQALLIIEVADSSLRKDRLVKLRVYAQARVPEYWIVDLENDLVHVHRQPSDAGYLQTASHGPGIEISPLAFADVVVSTDLLLPPR